MATVPTSSLNIGCVRGEQWQTNFYALVPVLLYKTHVLFSTHPSKILLYFMILMI